ncbi:MAG: hypothetical protein QOJ27_2828 [Sphingomonadales bacterium]|nr:hypothetical protein [Sphingomonadales bacterium]
MYLRNPPRRTAWEDLEALVLEEVEALSRPSPAVEIVAPPFACDEDFLARASAYFAGHDDPEGLLERLCSLPGLLCPEASPESKPESDSAEAAHPAPPDGDQGPAA